VKELEAYVGVTRQAQYQYERRLAARQAHGQAVLAQVQVLRQQQPRLGTRKLWHLLTGTPQALGRDRLFALLRRADLLIKPGRAAVRTTFPGGQRFPNRLARHPVTGPNQAWVCDITYLTTEMGYSYLALVTDVYSRRIMGYDLSTSLTAEGALRAVQMAMAVAGGDLTGLIHHSDHGIQYGCHAYQACLQAHGILPSMGQVGNCYDNALAERLNGILKQEYGLGRGFADFQQAWRATREAIQLYNHQRPHLSLGYLFPAQVYQQTALLSVT